MLLAFLINAHQNANQANRKCACIPGAVYTFTPADLPDPPFRFFRGSGSETTITETIQSDQIMYTLYLVNALCLCMFSCTCHFALGCFGV